MTITLLAMAAQWIYNNGPDTSIYINTLILDTVHWFMLLILHVKTCGII